MKKQHFLLAAILLASMLARSQNVAAGAFVDASKKVHIGNIAVTVIESQVPFTTEGLRQQVELIEELRKKIDANYTTKITLTKF